MKKIALIFVIVLFAFPSIYAAVGVGLGWSTEGIQGFEGSKQCVTYILGNPWDTDLYAYLELEKDLVFLAAGQDYLKLKELQAAMSAKQSNYSSLVANAQKLVLEGKDPSEIDKQAGKLDQEIRELGIVVSDYQQKVNDVTKTTPVFVKAGTMKQNATPQQVCVNLPNFDRQCAIEISEDLQKYEGFRVWNIHANLLNRTDLCLEKCYTQTFRGGVTAKANVAKEIAESTGSAVVSSIGAPLTVNVQCLPSKVECWKCEEKEVKCWYGNCVKNVAVNQSFVLLDGGPIACGMPSTDDYVFDSEPVCGKEFPVWAVIVCVVVVVLIICGVVYWYFFRRGD